MLGRGDAQFVVTVDGVQVGGTRTVTAPHSAGKSQVFTLTGSWGSGAKNIGVTFLNDAWGGTSSTDRNLYVDSLSYDGRAAAGTPYEIGSNGTHTFPVAAAASPASITITGPASKTVAAGGTVAVAGVKLADCGIASTSAITLTVSDSVGMLSMQNLAVATANGAALSGSGTHSITVTDALAHLNADLASLAYTAGSAAGSDSISFRAAYGSASGGAATVVAVTSPVVNASTYLQSHNFFAANSPWNTPIKPGATYSTVPGMTTMQDTLVSWVPNGATTAIYYAQNSDPVVEVFQNMNAWSSVANGSWLCYGNSASAEQQIMAGSAAINPMHYNPYSTQVDGGGWYDITSGITPYNQTTPLYFHCPAWALPSNNSDGQTVIIQPDGSAVELDSPIRLSNGNWVAIMFSETNALSGQGTGADNGRHAAEVPNYAGTIRDTDIQQGAINHAMAFLAAPSMMAAQYVNVAAAYDNGNNNYSGSLPMGALLALPSNTDLASMSLQTTFGKEVAQAAKTYGMYLVDQGGTGVSISVQDHPHDAGTGELQLRRAAGSQHHRAHAATGASVRRRHWPGRRVPPSRLAASRRGRRPGSGSSAPGRSAARA